VEHLRIIDPRLPVAIRPDDLVDARVVELLQSAHGRGRIGPLPLLERQHIVRVRVVGGGAGAALSLDQKRLVPPGPRLLQPAGPRLEIFFPADVHRFVGAVVGHGGDGFVDHVARGRAARRHTRRDDDTNS
jgi:hypothetical protein